MSFREDLLPMLDDLQDIPGPNCLDIRLNQVFIVERRFSEDVDLGTQGDCEVELLPRPMVRERDRGRQLVIKPVHQKYTDVLVGGTLRSGGFNADGVNPEDRDLVDILFRIEGPNAGEYDLVDFSASRPFRQTLILKRRPGTTGKRLAHPQPQGTSNDAF